MAFFRRNLSKLCAINPSNDPAGTGEDSSTSRSVRFEPTGEKKNDESDRSSGEKNDDGDVVDMTGSTVAKLPSSVRQNNDHNSNGSVSSSSEEESLSVPIALLGLHSGVTLKDTVGEFHSDGDDSSPGGPAVFQQHDPNVLTPVENNNQKKRSVATSTRSSTKKKKSKRMTSPEGTTNDNTNTNNNNNNAPVEAVNAVTPIITPANTRVQRSLRGKANKLTKNPSYREPASSSEDSESSSDDDDLLPTPANTEEGPPTSPKRAPRTATSTNAAEAMKKKRQVPVRKGSRVKAKRSAIFHLLPPGLLLIERF